MPQITFIKDVTLENEPEGSGPHFRRGYKPDVSPQEAQRWIKAGCAVMGVVDLGDPEEKELPLEIPTFKKTRRWSRNP
jgi:hypothetical protein